MAFCKWLTKCSEKTFCPPLWPGAACLTCANLSEGLRRRMAMRLRPRSARERRTITCTVCTCLACTAVAAAPTAARLASPLRHILSATHQSLSTCECSHANLILMHGLDIKVLLDSYIRITWITRTIGWARWHRILHGLCLYLLYRRFKAMLILHGFYIVDFDI